MTKETVRRLYKHYCECIETGSYDGKNLTLKSLDNMKKAKADIEKNRSWILEETGKKGNTPEKPKNNKEKK